MTKTEIRTNRLNPLTPRELRQMLRYVATVTVAGVDEEQVVGAFRSVMDAQMHLGLHRGDPGQVNRVRRLSGRKELLVVQWTTPERSIDPLCTPVSHCDCGCNGREHGPDRVFLLLSDQVRAAQQASAEAAMWNKLRVRREARASDAQFDMESARK